MNKIFSLEGKVGVVTGGAGGNGFAMTNALLSSCATVFVLDTDNMKIENAKKELEGKDVHFINVDITNHKKIEIIFENISKKQGTIDFLINNAGVTYPSQKKNYPDELWEMTLNINLKTPFKLSELVAKYMHTKGGSIVNITSLSSELGFAGNPSYSASKGGLKILTKSLAAEYAKYKIRVNNLGLGYFKTDMTEKSWNDIEKRKEIANRTLLDRWGFGVDLAGPIVSLVSDASSYVTGQDLIC